GRTGGIEGGAGGAVINLVIGGDARDGQSLRGDIGGGGGRAIGGVIGRIGAADGDAADAGGLGNADVLVVETGAGVARSEAVTDQAIIRERARGGGGTIIDLVDSGGADGQ